MNQGSPPASDRDGKGHRRNREVSPRLLGFSEGNFSARCPQGGGMSTGVLCNLTDLKLGNRNLLTIAPKPPAAQQSGNWNKFLGRKRAKRKSSLSNYDPNGPVLPSHSLEDEAFILWRCWFLSMDYYVGFLV